jgi:hypothetical protein
MTTWFEGFITGNKTQGEFGVQVGKPPLMEQGTFSMQVGKPLLAIVAGYVFCVAVVTGQVVLMVVEIGKDEAKDFEWNAHNENLMKIW